MTEDQRDVVAGGVAGLVIALMVLIFLVGFYHVFLSGLLA